MTYRFLNQPLENGLYEPEGIYLAPPFRRPAPLLQAWGAHPRFHGDFRYNGTALKGHPGVDFGLTPGTPLLAVDDGRVVEISREPGGFERYLKVEHRWGESFYAYLDDMMVESGQTIARGEEIATSGIMTAAYAPHLHFSIRIAPYNRFDGWGGFADPLPYLAAASFIIPDQEAPEFLPPPLLNEERGMRRP
ncbi:MAG: M23 family metallopeptidase [Caldilineaceae bacterium]|nr:M23 family metallopeptidase [Caldilineaceae bacterium]